MSALQYLNKKSWHTATIKNNEKIWLREQEAAKEKARIEELQKQLAEERRQEELQRLEEESGRVDPNASLKRQRLNWMYEYGRDEKENEKQRVAKEKEDVLLGKKPVDIETVGETERAERATLVDMEAKMREDPLVQIEIQRAKLRALAGIPDATTTTQDPRGLEKLRVPDVTKSDLLAKEKARRRDERRRVRELRQFRREKRASQGQDACVKVIEGSHANVHDPSKEVGHGNMSRRSGRREALASGERDRGQYDYGDARRSRQTRSDESYEIQACSPNFNKSERHSLKESRLGRRGSVHDERNRRDGRDLQVYKQIYDDRSKGYHNRKRHRDEKDDDTCNRDSRWTGGEDLSTYSRVENRGDYRRVSRWDLGPDRNDRRY